MKNKINNTNKVDNKDKILKSLYDKNLIQEDEMIVIASGFENAILGVSCSEPKLIVYDYWVSLDVLLKNSDIEFDDAQDWLDDFSLKNNKKSKHNKVIFVKTINPTLNY